MSNESKQCNISDVSVMCYVKSDGSTEACPFGVNQSGDQLTANIVVTKRPCEARWGRGSKVLRFINKLQRNLNLFDFDIWKHLETFGDIWTPSLCVCVCVCTYVCSKLHKSADNASFPVNTAFVYICFKQVGQDKPI